MDAAQYAALEPIRRKYGEDVMHDVAVALLRGELRDERAFYGYVWTIARRCAVERHPTAPLVYEDLVADPGPSPEEQVIAQDERRRLRGVLAGLRPRHRELLGRFYLDGEPLAEIAASMGLEWRQAVNAKHRAKALLERKLGAQAPIERHAI